MKVREDIDVVLKQEKVLGASTYSIYSMQLGYYQLGFDLSWYVEEVTGDDEMDRKWLEFDCDCNNKFQLDML